MGKIDLFLQGVFSEPFGKDAKNRYCNLQIFGGSFLVPFPDKASANVTYKIHALGSPISHVDDRGRVVTTFRLDQILSFELLK